MTKLKHRAIHKMHSNSHWTQTCQFVSFCTTIDCFRRIVREEGFSQLWSGVSPSLVLALNPAIQWMVYEALKRYLQKKLGIKVCMVETSIKSMAQLTK